MGEYIKRTDALNALKIARGYCPCAYDEIKRLPAEDVAPVRHGRWIKPVPMDGEPCCSECKAEQPWFYGYGYYEPDYCPNCGARMDGGDK